MICLLQPLNRKDKEGDNNNGPPQIPNAGEDTGEKDDIQPGVDGATPNTITSSSAETAANSRKQPRPSITAIYADDVEVPLQTIADCGKHLDYYEKSRLRVGIIIHTTQSSHRALACLANPASSCKVTALAVLKPPPSFSMGNLQDAADDDEDSCSLTPGSIMRKWMKQNNLGNHSESVAVLGGEEGARQLVQRDDVDAVFLIVPDEIHRKYAISALESRKHVLLNDPVSISLQSFTEQLEYARRFGKFVQSSTAFINQYRVRHFMECVLREEQFGRVTSMDAYLSVCPKDLPLVGLNQPPTPLGINQGCIRRLARYCVLFSLLLFTKLGSHPVSVKVHEAKFQELATSDGKKEDDDANNNDDNDNDEENKDAKPRAREPVKAKCSVQYSDNRELTLKVSYSSASSTRQRLEVKTDTSMATMSDFVFPHPDGLATYRVYEDVKKSSVAADIEVAHGEAIDIAGGPAHDVVMWRKFAELCRSVDEGGWDDSPLTERVRELSEITLHTKTILNALMESLEKGFVEVQL